MSTPQLLPMDVFWQTIASTVTSSVLAYLANLTFSHFGWRARPKEDTEAYKYLESVSEDNRTADEELVLTAIRNRSFETASQKMRQSTMSTEASIIALEAFAVPSITIVLTIPMGYVLPKLYEAVVGLVFRAWMASAALLMLSVVWSAIDANRVQNAQGLAKTDGKPNDVSRGHKIIKHVHNMLERSTQRRMT